MQVSSKHLNHYLFEFAYCFNRWLKAHPNVIFDRLLTARSTTQGITYKRIVAA
jgi:hypothetical protein